MTPKYIFDLQIRKRQIMNIINAVNIRNMGDEFGNHCKHSLDNKHHIRDREKDGNF